MSSTKILVYLDNSNIYFGLQLHAGRLKSLKPGVMDVTCRLKLEELISIVLHGREPDVQKAYGFMTNEVREMVRKAGFEVTQSTSSGFNSREKEADTNMTADGVEDLIIKRPNQEKPHGGTIIVMSGDQDMLPLVKKARKYGWNVEIWAFAETMSSSLKTEAERKEDGTTVTIFSQTMEDKFSLYTHVVPFQASDERRLKTERKTSTGGSTSTTPKPINSVIEPRRVNSEPTSAIRRPVNARPRESFNPKGVWCRYGEECYNQGCLYAHTKPELVCGKCSKRGSHPTEHCYQTAEGATSWRSK